MNHVASKLTVLMGVFAVSALFTAPALRAADQASGTTTSVTKLDKQAALKAKRDAAALKKYDKNGNGVLDPEELAKKQANEEKMKALREAKQRKAAERAQNAAAAPSMENK